MKTGFGGNTGWIATAVAGIDCEGLPLLIVISGIEDCHGLGNWFVMVVVWKLQLCW